MPKTPGDRARENFASEYNCAQSVLKAVLESRGLKSPENEYLMAGFGGGIARQGETCGAVSGAIAAIGMLLSQSEHRIAEHKNRTYEVAQRFLAGFREEFKCTHCSCLVGVNMGNPADRQRAADAGRFESICPKLVERAATLVTDLV